MSSVDLETLERRFEFGINARPTPWTRFSHSMDVVELGRLRWLELNPPSPPSSPLTALLFQDLAKPRAPGLPVSAKL